METQPNQEAIIETTQQRAWTDLCRQCVATNPNQPREATIEEEQEENAVAEKGYD